MSSLHSHSASADRHRNVIAGANNGTMFALAGCAARQRVPRAASSRSSAVASGVLLPELTASTSVGSVVAVERLRQLRGRESHDVTAQALAATHRVVACLALPRLMTPRLGQDVSVQSDHLDGVRQGPLISSVNTLSE